MSILERYKPLSLEERVRCPIGTTRRSGDNDKKDFERCVVCYQCGKRDVIGTPKHVLQITVETEVKNGVEEEEEVRREGQGKISDFVQLRTQGLAHLRRAKPRAAARVRRGARAARCQWRSLLGCAWSHL